MRINYKKVAKFIAPLDMVLSAFVFIMELINPFPFKYAVLIGIDIEMFYAYPTQPDEVISPSRKLLITLCYVYAGMEWLCSMFLLWALVVKQRGYAVPWVSCKTGSCLFQIASLLFYLITQKLWNRNILLPACFNIGITYAAAYIVHKGVDELSSERTQNEDEGFSLCGRICGTNEEPDSAQSNEEVPESAQRTEDVPASAQIAEELPESSQRAEELPESSQKAEEGLERVQNAEELPKSCQGTEEQNGKSQMAEKLPESGQELPQNDDSAEMLSDSVQKVEKVSDSVQRNDGLET
ncbi:uncharacterized protein LOC110835798 [Zootermopsis nevadensis]|uniref:Uncharacterized protein n=1 Tax=Zootermopsis nevadensis TaxID=136037 RepID=A0A067QTA0_ZOONE|nr:uncharacterized protein LOC110835798 [Zootermopsis nevadensis]KDR12946.1 hypothetical protein L798_12903 [Zootermopsis nevadensis]